MGLSRKYCRGKKWQLHRQQLNYKFKLRNESDWFAEITGFHRKRIIDAYATVSNDAGTRTSKYFVVNVEVFIQYVRFGNVSVLIPFNQPNPEYIYFADSDDLTLHDWYVISSAARKLYCSFFHCELPYHFAYLWYALLNQGGDQCKL